MSDYDEPTLLEKETYHWGYFVIWAKGESVSLDHVDDYGPWWDCWKTAQIKDRASG